MTKNSTFSETDIFVVNGMTNIALNNSQLGIQTGCYV